MPHGVIASIDQQGTALAAGADYLESTIVGVLVEEDGEGGWRAREVAPERRVPSFAVLVPGSLKVSDPSVPFEDLRAYFATVLDAIAAVAEPGAKIVLGSGASRTIGPDIDRAAGEERFAQSVVLVRDGARERGMQVILEPLHQGETDLINSVQEAAAFLDAHGIADVPIVADLFHVQLEAEPFAAIEKFAGRVGHVHVADSGRVPPGQGDWPIADFLSALRRGGYDGSVTIECRWEDLAAELPAALAAVRAADPAAA